MKIRTIVGAAAGMALVFPLAGCVVEAADPSGVEASAGITVACGNIEELCESVLTEFTESTGIPANYVRMSGGEALARLESTKGAASAEFDVWWGGPVESFVAATEADLLASYLSPERDNIQESLRDADGYWTGYVLNPNGICYSVSAFDELGLDAPTSWDTFLDPALSKNVATSHPATSGTGFGFITTILALNDNDEDAMFDWMLDMHPNVLQYTQSGSAPVQMLVRGEVAAVPAFASVCEREHVVNGNDDIAFAYPEEGVGFEVGGTAVVAGASNPAGAEAFTDWALGQEAFDAYVNTGYNVFPAFVGEGANNGLGQTVDDIPWLASFDPTASEYDRGELAERFDTDVAPTPVD